MIVLHYIYKLHYLSTFILQVSISHWFDPSPWLRQLMALHIWREHALITKSTYYAMNISSTEAELFTIRCGISQAIHINDITNIVVVTDAISAAKRIFDMLCYPFQLHSIAISRDLRAFFNQDPRNSITFWDCPSDNEWPPHHLVDKESKTSKFNPILPSKTSWDYSRKDECDSIIQKWQMYFQASDYKGRSFLDLNDDNGKPI